MSRLVRMQRGARPAGWKMWLTLMLLVALLAVGLTILLATSADAKTGPQVSVSPQVAAPGTSISTTGSGFKSRVKGKVFFGGQWVATFTTSKRGRFSTQWTVPEGAASGSVVAKASSRQASTRLEVEDSQSDGQQRWSDPATWNGEVPGKGDSVTVPADKTIVLDTSPPALKSLQVDGTLVFEDKDLNLEVDWVVVNGKLQIGTEETPFKNRAKITLTGSDTSENVMGMGPKVLGVMGGTLDIHGQQRSGWTRLNATVNKGSNRLTLEDASGWRPGDRIAISSTDYDQDQAEEANIAAISGNTVTLDKTLANSHWGTEQTYDGRTVDERAEVALLTRNVAIEGEEASSTDGFGGQIMVMNGGTARVEGAELNRMGQKNTLRRYPIHFHMLGDAGADSYLKNSSVHNAFNRCVVVHGTNKLAIQNNVCYDHVGHGYFFEDGAEVDNLLEGNLGLVTRKPEEGERLLPSDRSPATFWITNPDNTVRNNVAAGSEGTGFWLAFPEHPTGLFAKDKPSEADKIWPRRTPLGEFSGNVAHSNDYDGLHVDNGPKPDGNTERTFYDPREDPADPDSAAVESRFEGFAGHRNRNRAVWLRGANQRLANATLADNAIGATFASEESFLQDSLVVGETANKGNPGSWETKGEDGRSLPRYWEADFPIRGYEFYDGRVGTERTTFAYFMPNGQRKASGLGYELSNAFSIHTKNYATSLRFVSANRVYLPDPEAGYDGDAAAVFLDTDGSVTGTADRRVAANNPFLLDSSCQYETDWNAHVCEADYASLWVATLDDDPQDVTPLSLERDDGKTQTLMGSGNDYELPVSSVLPKRNYGVTFNGSKPSKALFALWRTPQHWIRLSVDYPIEPKVTKYGCDLADSSSGNWCKGKAGNLTELDASKSSAYYYDPGTKKLYLKIVADGHDWEPLEVQTSP